MKRMAVVVLGAASLLGAVLAFRWLRGETEYEKAIRALEAQPLSPGSSHSS